MAHLVRPWQTRYVDAKGRRCKKGTPGARPRRERARKWYGQGVPGFPPNKRFPLASDKTVARQLLADLVKQAERGEAGLADRTTEAQAVPLADHLLGFRTFLESRNVSPKQVNLTLSRIRAVFAACEFVYPRDVTAGDVESHLLDLRVLPKGEGGISVQTSNYYLQALNQFCGWMVQREKMVKNPLAQVHRGNPDRDRRHSRRDLKPEELTRLLDVTAASPKTVRRLTGADRHLLYLTACGSGFRAKELAVLTPEAFALDADPPTVTLGAKFTKNNKPVVQPLPAAVADPLRGYLAGKTAGQRVWPGPWFKRAAGILRRDLAAAGIPYVVEGPDGPLYADFHALRHTFVTMLDRSGVTVKAAQALARHSDVRLTLNRYTHADRAALGEAVNRLDLPGTRPPDAGPTVEQLAAAYLLLQEIATALLGVPHLLPGLVAPPVARRVAPACESDRDEPGRAGTKKGGGPPKGPPPKC